MKKLGQLLVLLATVFSAGCVSIKDYEAEVVIIGADWCQWCAALKESIGLNASPEVKIVVQGVKVPVRYLDKDAPDFSLPTGASYCPGIPEIQLIMRHRQEDRVQVAYRCGGSRIEDQEMLRRVLGSEFTQAVELLIRNPELDQVDVREP